MATDVAPDDFEGHFVDPFEVCSSSIFITIGLITLFVYIRIVKYHIKYGFKTHYQKIFLVCLTNDLLMHYSLLFRIRLPTWGVYEFFWNVQEGVIPAILAVGYMFSVLFQELGTLLIAINRATSLTFPQHYEWFWSRYTWHTCIGCTLFCSLYTGPVFTDSSFFYRASWGYYIPYTLNQSPLTQALDNGYFPLCLSIVFICFLVNIYTCIRLYFHSRSMQRAINRREMAFHVLTVFQFIMQAVNTGDMIITNTQSMDDFWFFFEFSPVFSDLTNFLPLWFLLLISEETRMIVTGKLKGRDGVHTKTAVSTISMQNSPRLLQSSMLMANAKSTNPGLNHSKTTSNMYGNA